MATLQKIQRSPEQSNALIQVSVSLPELIDLCQQAQKAGISSPISDQLLAQAQMIPQTKENSWFWTGAKVAAGIGALAVIGYSLDCFGMQEKVGLIGAGLLQLSQTYLPAEVHSALEQVPQQVVEQGERVVQWVDQTVNVTASAQEVLRQVSGKVDTTVKVAKVGGAVWLLSILSGPVGALGRLYAWTPLPGASALRHLHNRR